MLVDTNKVLVAVAVTVGVALLYQARLLVKRASKVVRCLGKNGQEMVKLVHASGAVCEVYLHGATVTRYATAGGHEVLWVSKGAVFDGKKGIRGGIPLVFPQFGPKADELLGVESMAQHGFARNTKWAVQSAEVMMRGDCRVVLTLRDSEATRDKYPHKFELEYTVSLDAARLRTALKITNMDEEGVVAPQALLHTYLATDQVSEAEVLGLEGHAYLDQLTAQTHDERGAAVRFVGETDRVYDDVKTLSLRVGCRGQRAVVKVELDAASHEEFGEAGAATKPFAPDVVVWNPHVAKAKAMSDFDDDGWKFMLCVEPGVLRKSRPAISPGNSLVLAQTLTHLS